MPASTPAFQGIANLDEDFVSEALTVVPSYDTRVADAIGRTIRCIHGLEGLHRTVYRDELDVYLGRATEGTVAQRWRSHSQPRRNHVFGAILFTCDPERVERLEDVALKVLTKLKERDMLCVGNANCHDRPTGGKPRANERAVIYITWKKGQLRDWQKPGIHDIRAIATEVADTTDVKASSIMTGLGVLKRMTEADPLHWWEP